MINSFRGKYFFLSNMSASPIKLGGVEYSCAEAAFQAVKLSDKKQRKMFEGLSGAEAKALGRKVKLRSDWDEIRLDVMRWVIHEKFSQNPELATKLRQTLSEDLIEGNEWGDFYWGQCGGRGQNWLGKILMEERKAISE